jgi:hypothetical protein
MLHYKHIACSVTDFNVLRILYNLPMNGGDVSKLTGLAVLCIYFAFNRYCIFNYCATSRTISGSIPDGVTGDIFRSYLQKHMTASVV